MSCPEILQMVCSAVDLDSQLASPVHLIYGIAFPKKISSVIYAFTFEMC